MCAVRVSVTMLGRMPRLVQEKIKREVKKRLGREDEGVEWGLYTNKCMCTTLGCARERGLHYTASRLLVPHRAPLGTHPIRYLLLGTQLRQSVVT